MHIVFLSLNKYSYYSIIKPSEMSNQIVYTQQSIGNKNDDDLSNINRFFINSEQLRILNLLMPLGYVLAPKSKILPQILKKKQSIVVDKSNRKPKSTSPPPVKVNVPEIIVRKQPPKTLTPDMAKCLQILNKLKKNPKSIIFHNPVDTIVIPDYLTIIKEPMDFSTIEESIQKQNYVSINQFISDIKKVWSNAYTYNAKGSQIYQLTMEIEKFFHKILQEEGLYNSSVQVLAPVVEKTNIPIQPRLEPIKKKPSIVAQTSEIAMTMQQKRNLGVLIKKLPRDYLRGVWEIVCDYDGQTPQNTQLEFDIEALSVKKARSLQQYVKQVFNSLEFKRREEQLKKQQQQHVIHQQESQNESSFLISDDD